MTNIPRFQGESVAQHRARVSDIQEEAEDIKYEEGAGEVMISAGGLDSESQVWQDRLHACLAWVLVILTTLTSITR